jgi:hypothetical protein
MVLRKILGVICPNSETWHNLGFPNFPTSIENDIFILGRVLLKYSNSRRRNKMARVIVIVFALIALFFVLPADVFAIHIEGSWQNPYADNITKFWENNRPVIPYIEPRQPLQAPPPPSQPPPQISSDNLTSLLEYGDKPVSILGLFSFTRAENVTAKIENAYYVGFQEAFKKAWQEGYQNGEKEGYSQRQNDGYSSGYNARKSERSASSSPNYFYSVDVPPSIDRNTDPGWSYRQGYQQGASDAASNCR